MFLVNRMTRFPISIQYQLRDGSTAVDDKFGLKDCSVVGASNNCIDGKPRPAYSAVQNLTNSLSNYRYVTRLGGGSVDYVLIFKHITTGATKAAVWTTGKTHNITVKPAGKPAIPFSGVSNSPKYVDVTGKI